MGFWGESEGFGQPSRLKLDRPHKSRRTEGNKKTKKKKNAGYLVVVVGGNRIKKFSWFATKSTAESQKKRFLFKRHLDIEYKVE